MPAPEISAVKQYVQRWYPQNRFICELGDDGAIWAEGFIKQHLMVAYTHDTALMALAAKLSST